MTTIATRAGIIAADSRETDEEAGTFEPCQKLFRKLVGRGANRRHVIIGTSGGTYAGMVFVDWYGSGLPVPAILFTLDPTDEDFEVLILDRGKVYTCNHFCRPVEVVANYTAIGTGKMAALAAMRCGRGAAEAVRIACNIDPYSGLPITVMSAPGRRRKV